MPTPTELIDDLAESNHRRAEAAEQAKKTEVQGDTDRALQKAVFAVVQELTAALAGDKTKGEALGFILNKIEEFDGKVGDHSTELETLKAGMKQLEQELGEVPVGDLKQLPKFLQSRDKVQITNLDNLEACIERVEDLLKKQKLVVKAPDVHVKAPIVDVKPADVHIPDTDWNPLLTALDAVRGEVRKLKKGQYDDDGNLETVQPNLLISEKFDELRLGYDDFDTDNPSPNVESVTYLYKGKVVAKLVFKYNKANNLISTKRTK